jgi:hypothetical protein
MSRSSARLSGLVATVAAGVALAGGHSGAATGGGQTGGGGSGITAYSPATVGDTWVYAVSHAGKQQTATSKLTAVSPVAGGRQLSIATGSPTVTNTSHYVVHPDGSVTIPGFGSGQGNFKVKPGTLGWPSPAQLASGQEFHDNIVVAGSELGMSSTETVSATVKGEGTQSVTVPAGTYSATLMDEVETETVLGHTATLDTKTWLVDGIGPVKTVMTALGGGSASLNETEEMRSFTKG